MEPSYEKVAPLTSDNYASWKEDVTAILMDRDCYEIIEGTEEAPSAEVSDKVLKSYRARKNRAFSTIYLNVSKELRPLIAETHDGKTAWDILKKHFRPDSRARMMGLLDQFFSCRIGPDESIGLYAARLKKLVSQLQDCGEKLDDRFQAFQLIRYLPIEFSGIVQSIYRWADDKFKFDAVLEELLAEEARLVQSRKDSEQASFSGHVRREISEKKFQQKPIIKCQNCGRKGHLKASCTAKNSKKWGNVKRKEENCFIMEACISEERYNPNAWVFDSAASTHFCGDKRLFDNFIPTHNTDISLAVDNVSCPIEGTGTVNLEFLIGKCREKVKLTNVMYSPRIRHNLIAGSRLDKGGAKFIGKNGEINIFNHNRKIIVAKLQRGLYYCFPINKRNIKGVALETSVDNNLRLWHEKFNHINVKYIVDTVDAVKGLPKLKSEKIDCEPCKLAKTRSKSFKASGKIRSKKPLELVHTDICGPMPTASLQGYKYFLSIIDDFSRKVVVYPIKHKSEALECFKRFQARAERFANCKILNIRCDNGREFNNTQFVHYFENQGIKIEFTNTYTPQQNGVAERYNYTAMDGVKTLLKSSGLSEGFWAEALLAFTYTWNRVCHQRLKKTPFELFGGHKPSVTHLKAFGTTAYVGTPRQLRRKFDMRAKKGVMVGYAMKTKGYRIYIPAEKRVVETINVSFEEPKFKPSNDVIKSGGAVLDSLKNKTEIANFPQSPESVQNDLESELPKKTEYEKFQEYSESESEPSDNEEVKIACTSSSITWIRKAVPRKDCSRTDIYYYIKGQNTRFRSNNEVKEYCENHNLDYTPELFNFSGKITYSGEMKDGKELKDIADNKA